MRIVNSNVLLDIKTLQFLFILASTQAFIVQTNKVNMSFFKKAFYALTTLAFMQGANCLLDPGSKSNVAVYWGQGQSDTSLAQFCESRKYSS